MVVDATSTITIRTLANPHAFIDAVRQLDPATSIWYNLYPEGQQGYCTAARIGWINLRIRNDGTLAGTLYLKITKPDGGIIFDKNYSLGVNAYYDEDQISFDMPATDLTLTFELGHY
jgi:hypothetical protein